MSATLERKLEAIQRVLDNLAAESSRGTAVLVEGRKDVKTLEKLAITGNVIPAKGSGKNIPETLAEVEKQGKSEIILLMDFDRRGREWTSRLARGLEAMKIKPNLVFWRELSGLVGRDVKDVEGLATYIQSLRRKTGKNILDMEQ